MKQPKAMQREMNPFVAAHNLAEVIDLADGLTLHLDDIALESDTGTLVRRIGCYLKLAAMDCEVAIRMISQGNLERAKATKPDGAAGGAG